MLVLSIVLSVLTSCSKRGKLDTPALTANSFANSIELIWSAVPNASGYSIIYEPVQSSSTTVPPEIKTTDETVVIDGLTTSTAYVIAIKAIGSDSYYDSEYASITVTTASEDLSFNASVSSCSFSSIDVKFNTGQNVVKAEYATVSIFDDLNTAISMFKEGKLSKDSVTVARTIASARIVRKSEETLVNIIARGISADGKYTEIRSVDASFAPVHINFNKTSLAATCITVGRNFDDAVPYFGCMTMTEDTPSRVGKSAEEIVREYAESGKIGKCCSGESSMVKLCGEPNAAQYVGLVYFDTTSAISAVRIQKYVSGKITEGAPGAETKVAVSDTTDSSANFTITANDNSYGYYFNLFKKADYDSLVEKGKAAGYQDPEQYVREQVAQNGLLGCFSQTIKCSGLEADTEHILVCYPFNVNGKYGYGTTAHAMFKTKSKQEQN